MRWVGLLCVLGTTAGAGPLERKPPPGTLKLDVLESFIAGYVSERWGDLQQAWTSYETAISRDHGDGTALFNHALLALSVGKVFDAKVHFKYYLERTPNAPDRAAVEKIIDELEHGDPVLTLGGKTKLADEADALIVVDGVVAGSSPQTLTVKPGRHDAERITRTTYTHRNFEARSGQRDYIRLDTTSSGGGNVVIVGLRDNRWTEAGQTFATGARFTLPKGHYTTSGRDHLDRPATCAPIAFDVKSDTDLTYVHVDGKAGDDCFTVAHLTVQVLKVSAL